MVDWTRVWTRVALGKTVSETDNHEMAEGVVAVDPGGRRLEAVALMVPVTIILELSEVSEIEITVTAAAGRLRRLL